jgi:hypothetical protein
MFFPQRASYNITNKIIVPYVLIFTFVDKKWEDIRLLWELLFKNLLGLQVE